MSEPKQVLLGSHTPVFYIYVPIAPQERHGQVQAIGTHRVLSAASGRHGHSGHVEI